MINHSDSPLAAEGGILTGDELVSKGEVSEDSEEELSEGPATAPTSAESKQSRLLRT